MRAISKLSLVTWAVALALSGIAPSLSGAHAANMRQQFYNCYAQNRAKAPPQAYICAYSYIELFGLDRQGLEVQRWLKAYLQNADKIYASDSLKFGLNYGDLSYVQASGLWGVRNNEIEWFISPAADSFYTRFKNPQGVVSWWGLGAVHEPPFVNEAPSLAVWNDPKPDWQAIAPDGTALNKASARSDLIQAIQPVNGHKPSRLFASPTGGWVLVWDDIKKVQCSSEEQSICDWAIKSVLPAGAVPRDVAIGNKGAWAAIYGDNGFGFQVCPTGLYNALSAANKARQHIESLGLFPNGGWYVKVKVRAH